MEYRLVSKQPVGDRGPILPELKWLSYFPSAIAAIGAEQGFT
jgi:hypothetical protein